MKYSHALDNHYDDLIPDITIRVTIPRPRIVWRFVAVLAGVIALVTVVVLSTPPAVEAYRSFQAAQVEAAAASVTWEPRELTREWRWEPKAVEYEHMFMSKR